MSGNPGTNWNGHLPSTRIEREMYLAIDGCEDEEGRPIGSSHFIADPDAGPEEVVRSSRQHNTGVKGVIEDERRARAAATMKVRADVVRQQELLKLKTMQVRPGQAVQEEEEDSDEDDDAFKAFRMQRLKEMQQHATKIAQLPIFGRLEEVTSDNFVEYVEEGAETFVVMHLYEDYLPECVRLNFRLDALAKKFNQVKFGQIVATDAKATIDVSVLPQLIVYKGGEYVSDKERVHKLIGEEMPPPGLEDLLRHMGVRLTSGAAPAMSTADARLLERYLETHESDDDSDGDSDDGKRRR